MKKIFLVFISLIFIMCLAGCGTNEDKIIIDFIIDGKSYLVKIDRGTSISKEIIPLSNDNESVELYYDENMENEYNDESINNDLIIYVKKMPEDLDVMITKAKKDFFEQYNGELFTKECYGIYENSIFFFIHGEAFDVSNPKPVNQVITNIYIYGLSFSYKHDFTILMYNEGEFYDLSNPLAIEKVMKEKKLNYESVQKLYNKHLELTS